MLNNSPAEVSADSSKCACRGVRYCALCLNTERVSKRRRHEECRQTFFNDYPCFVYQDGKAHRVADSSQTLVLSSPADDILRSIRCVHECTSDCFSLFGVKLVSNFVSQSEEQLLVSKIDNTQWVPSQSGRRKQDFGPRVNFKFQRVNVSNFAGLPDYIDPLLERMRSVEGAKDILDDFSPVEVCNLEYCKERMSSIDAHKDDEWIWGERIISISLNSDCLITLEHPSLKMHVFIPIPRRSLLCLFAEARSVWNHGIFPHHITERRIVITLRELSKIFLKDQTLFELYGKEMLEKSSLRIRTMFIPQK